MRAPRQLMYFLTRERPSIMRPVAKPSLAIWGLRDRGHAAAKTNPNSILALLPNAQVRILDDVGHWPEAENPLQFAHIFFDFVDRAVNQFCRASRPLRGDLLPQETRFNFHRCK
jgi:pimeloyl-ACP methyl ester carboxylesterase